VSDARLRQWHAAARARRAAIVVAFALPWLLALLALAWRFPSPWTYAGCALAAIAMGAIAWRRAQRADARWFARRLDARRADMEDSAALLFARETGTALQALQRERLRARIAASSPTDLRDPWPRRTLALSAMSALIAIAGVTLWPAPRGPGAQPEAATAARSTSHPALPAIVASRLEIRPPAYTGLPRRAQAGLAASAVAGSTLHWALRFAPQPASAALEFHDGRTVTLQPRDGAWSASMRIDRSMLYRIVLPTPLPETQSILHRIDVIADAPPVLRTLRPTRNLSVLTPGQRSWPLSFEAEDDYGLAPQARLRVIQTQGAGEDITTRERSIALRGSGGARRRRWSHALDLAALGLSPGDDVIVRLTVSDNRAPRPQRASSPSFILRWPPEDSREASGMDGLVRTTLPAYLRSQRQVIIDAEALLKQRRSLDAERFRKRSSGLGEDQQALRLRYGRFLGEESEGAPALPTNDLPTADPPASAPPSRDLPTSDPAHTPAAAQAHDDHDPGTLPAPPPKFGDAGNVLADFGHEHDTAEAATLFDPKTKETLRSALREMWQSELHLRQGDPAAALPYAYRALAYIKEVQQADRVYLARTGIEVPPIDESRRLGGDRAGLGNRHDVLAGAPPPDPVPVRAWQALQESPAASRGQPDFDALERWVRGRRVEGADPLAVIAAIDGVRRDPACKPCRARLRTALWPLLARPPATAATRPRPDATGRAYLEALEGSRTP
jgi:hypothetical protein